MLLERDELIKRVNDHAMTLICNTYEIPKLIGITHNTYYKFMRGDKVARKTIAKIIGWLNKG